jgi:Holliday junction resolvase
MALLKKQPQTWAIRYHNSGWTRRGIPDIVGCVHGRFFAIEAKTQSGRATKAQHYIASLIRSAGGAYLEARNTEEVETWLINASKID